MTSIARINKNDQNLMYRTLDRGVQGIVVPNVQTKAEAENVVQGCYYQPIGMRGVFTSRQGSGVADFHDVVNAEVLTVVLLENVPALDANLDEILTVEHIDVFMVTTGDLAQSMGLLSDRANPKVIAKQARPLPAGRPSPPLLPPLAPLLAERTLCALCAGRVPEEDHRRRQNRRGDRDPSRRRCASKGAGRAAALDVHRGVAGEERCRVSGRSEALTEAG